MLDRLAGVLISQYAAHIGEFRKSNLRSIPPNGMPASYCPLRWPSRFSRTKTLFFCFPSSV